MYAAIPINDASLYERLFKARIELALAAQAVENEEINNKTIKSLKNDICSLPIAHIKNERYTPHIYVSRRRAQND